MKAIVYHNYGSPDVLSLEEVAKPTPKDDEVLVKVHAAAANAGDIYRMHGKPFLIRLMGGGLFQPTNKILGSDIAGRVEAVGRNVTAFQPGDEVFGDLSENGCGGFAEYACIPEAILALKPATLSFEEAAAVPMASVTALNGLRDYGQIQAGHTVLINGASGGVGSFAVQIAKALGAEVTAVCSTGKMEMVRSLGADHVIDYTQEDFTQNGQQYDLILAANGNRHPSEYKRLLTPQGVYVCTGGSMKQLFQTMLLGGLMSKKGGQTVTAFESKPNHKDLTFMTELLEAGKVAPVIDKRYSFAETPDAMRYLEQGHAKGKVVIAVA